MSLLSIVIPSYKDALLHKTIDDILKNAEGEIEIIPVLDGYWTLPIQNKRVRVVHLGKNRGMRGAICAGVAVARGEYLMRTDEHCSFSKGFDRVVLKTIQPNWIVCMRQYYLDPIKWERMDIPPVDFQKLVIQGGKKFAGQRWPNRDEELKDVPIAETMAMQGSCWIMPRKWWDDVIVALDTEHYGQLIQDSHEMVFKTWKMGGKLMLNKEAWFAHKHRNFSRTHNNGTQENPANQDKGYAYSLNLWRNYYDKEIRTAWKI